MLNKFTVLIPTRERSELIKHTLKACLNQNYDNYQIIVSDNFSSDQTKDVVLSFNDPRIKYVNTGRRVSMSENFEFALSQVDDGYVMFLGDDDGIVPNSLDYVNDIINATGVEAVASHNACYTWPGTVTPNTLSWSDRAGYELRDSKLWLKKYLTFQMGYTFDLPGAYCGFVKREVFDRLLKNDCFFHSATPDAYSALAVAAVTERYVYSHTAFAVHGSSARSNGGAYLSQKKGEEKEEVKAFFKENTIPFHSSIVMTKSFRVCSVEAFCQLKDNFPELMQDWDVDWQLFLRYVLTERKENIAHELEEAVKAMCIIHDLNFNEIINSVPSPSRFAGMTAQEFFSKAMRKIYRFLFSKKTHIEDTTVYGVNNIYDAMLLLRFFTLCDFR